jgi:isopenicillin N synthase-like dioxygenase
MTDFTAQLDDRLRAMREPFDRIPVVDLAPLLDGSDKAGVARAINWALTNVGFMYVKNHGIASSLVDATFAQARAFFDLSEEDKMAVHVSRSGTTLRGYIEPFGENTDPTRSKDLKEVFDLGPETPGDLTPFFGANLWPDAGKLPGFAETVYAYHEMMRRLSLRMLQGIALSLDLEEDFFATLVSNPICIQRLLHYPPQRGAVDESIIGIGAHTDYGNLTILAQDDVGGLQVMNRDGAWVEAPPIPGTFVINIGDLVQRLTNDLYLANLHRVVNTSGRERYSIPFFIDANYDAQFGPLPTCVTPDNPARYQTLTCGAHKFGRFRDSYPHLADAG